jgi:PAS domain S-box-containing protein
MIETKDELFQLLRKSDQALEFFQNNAKGFFWIWNPTQPDQVYLSPGFWEHLGYNQLSGITDMPSWRAVIFPEDALISEQHTRRQLEDPNYRYGQVINYLHRNGQTVRLLSSSITVCDVEDEGPYLLGALEPIGTEVIPVVNSSDINLEVFFETSESLLCVIDENFKIKRVNDIWESRLQITRKEMMEVNFLDFLHREDRRLVDEYLRQLFAGRPDAKFIGRVITDAAKKHIIEWKAKASNEMLYLVGTEVTEQVDVQRELVENRNFIDKVLKTLPGHIFIYDLEKKQMTFSNMGLTRYFDRGELEVKLNDHSLFGELLHPDDRSNMARFIFEMSTANDNEVVERIFRLIEKGSIIRYFRTHCLVFKRNEQGKVIQFCGKALDVTGLVYAENRLIESEERTRALLEHGGDLYVVASPNELKYVSPNVRRVLGYTEQEYRDIPVEELVHPDDQPLRWNELQEPGSSLLFEYRCKHKQGHYIWMEAFGINLFHVEAVQGMVFNMRDITERKNIELAVIRQGEQLERKNHELEQFAYIASHDLLEPIRTLRSISDLLKAEYQENLEGDGLTYIDFIERSTERMSELITSLLEYARIGKELNASVVDVEDLVTNAVEDLKLVIRETGAELSVGAMPRMRIYPIELRQVFQNILNNALKFRAKDRLPKIVVQCEMIPGGALFRISDNGIGIAENSIDRIFKIFNRLHSRHEIEGVGIGLAHSKKIVELHGGRIWVESVLDKGSTFCFTIQEVAE